MRNQLIKNNIVLFLILITICLGQVSFAQDKEEKETQKSPMVKGVIHGTGTISRISADEVVIEDQLFQIVPNAPKKLAEDGSFYSGSLKKGMHIGIELNKDRKIVTIWVLGKKE